MSLTELPAERTLRLPCGHVLHSQNIEGEQAEAVHTYRFARDTLRHDCKLVSHTNPSGFRDKRAGE